MLQTNKGSWFEYKIEEKSIIIANISSGKEGRDN